MCLYDAAIWVYYSTTVFNKLRSCYNKCIKIFFGYNRRYSVTLMLAELKLPSFDVFMSNGAVSFNSRWAVCTNSLVCQLNCLHLEVSLAVVVDCFLVTVNSFFFSNVFFFTACYCL